MGRLEGRVAIVTGGSRGIGRSIAQRFAREGAQVVATGRTTSPSGATGESPVHFKADVADSAEVGALFDFVLRRFGRLDILVNNAGIGIEKPLEETSEAEWNWLMGVNLKGVFLCSKRAIPAMRAGGGGCILNLGSISGIVADAGMPAYNASKAAVHGLTRSIAIDHGRDGIRCNAICPGWIMTDMLQQAFAREADTEAARRTAIERHPVGRLGTPEDIANLALWLASDEGSFASGQLYTLDGGLTAGSPINPQYP